MERYENLGVVGEGSYGVVLKCRHRETGQIVAVKKFLEGEDDPSVKKIALREVRMLKRLRHENLINLIEFFRRKRRLYLVFEYVDHTILDELEEACGGLPEQTARAHIFQVLRGIAFCHHNQIIHRDVKPENVLVSKLGVVKLCDFGFARLVANPGEAFTDYVATRWYRAPELLVGDTRYGKEVDVWAVGCLLAEMLTADPLFPGDSDIDQLFHIIQALGELSAHHQTLVERNPMMSSLHMPAAASTPLSITYPSWSPRSLAFIKACLNLVPNERPSAQTLLAHDFFLHDAFPDTFLPLLRQKVQQEFNGNALLSKESRRGSGGAGTKRSKKGKGGLLSPEAIYGRSVAHGGSSSKSELAAAPRRSSIKVSNNSNQPNSNANRSGLYYGVNPPSDRRAINIEDGPPSLPMSTMPPLRDSGMTNYGSSHSNSNYSSNPTTFPSTTSYFSYSSTGGNTSTSSYQSTKPMTTFSGSPTKIGSFGLQISALTSPSKASDRGTKSPMNLWSSNTRQRMPAGTSSVATLPQSVHNGPKRSNSNPDDDDLTLLLNETALPSTASSRSNSNSRQYPFEIYRHPYTISLDQTKELTTKPVDTLSQKDYHALSREQAAREQLAKDSIARDPLREIKDNSRETGRPMKQEPQETNLRRPRMDITSWVKSKFNQDDLSLPNVPGVVGTSLGSPLKSQRATAGDDMMSTPSGRGRRAGGVTMPALGNSQLRTSANSIPRLPSHPSQIFHSYDTTTSAAPPPGLTTTSAAPPPGLSRSRATSLQHEAGRRYSNADEGRPAVHGLPVMVHGSGSDDGKTGLGNVASRQLGLDTEMVTKKGATGLEKGVNNGLPKRSLNILRDFSAMEREAFGWNRKKGDEEKRVVSGPSNHRASGSAGSPSSHVLKHSGSAENIFKFSILNRMSVSAESPAKEKTQVTRGSVGSADSMSVIHSKDNSPLPSIRGRRISLPSQAEEKSTDASLNNPLSEEPGVFKKNSCP